MDDYNEVIGIRGEARQGRTGSILCIVMGIFLIFMFTFFVISLGKNEEISDMIPLIAVESLVGIVLIIFGIINLRFCIANDRVLDKPVLIYDRYRDVFVGYDARHNNREIVIRNGDIVKIRGSAMTTGRELFIYYRNEEKEGKVRKSSFGFCRNIDNYAFKTKLNEFHTPHI